MAKHTELELKMEEWGGELDNLANKIGFIATALRTQETAIVHMDTGELRGAGFLLSEIQEKIDAISALLSDQVERDDALRSRG
jgi:hypothetical protein